MTQKFEISGISCEITPGKRIDEIIYILYPMKGMEFVVRELSAKYDITTALITGMDWDDDLTPWPAPGVPEGCPDFKGNGMEFFRILTEKIVPEAEGIMQFGPVVKRILLGVSLSGLFTLWQWIFSDVFTDIASLSGSFWYKGFTDWLSKQTIVNHSGGKAYFSLGDKESSSSVSDFDSVGEDTQIVIRKLQEAGIETKFESVPGNHYAHPIERLKLSFGFLFG